VLLPGPKAGGIDFGKTIEQLVIDKIPGFGVKELFACVDDNALN
jgi:hypothetical protein